MVVELVVLAVIVIGLVRRRGETWEFSRRRVAEAADRLAVTGERTVRRVRRSLPELLAVCVADMRSLFEDVSGVLHPRARRRIEAGARGMMARRRERRARRAPHLGALPAGAGLPTERREPVTGRAQRAYASLQKRYLEGAISLDQYVDEAGRLRTDDPSG